MTQKHTPGPWRFDEDWNAIWGGDCDVEIVAPNGCQFATDARFIVAACNAHYDMLEALKRLEYWLDMDPELFDRMTHDERRVHVRMHKLTQAAIAKAEGGDA